MNSVFMYSSKITQIWKNKTLGKKKTPLDESGGGNEP
jgi:hypothetical protein